MSIASYIVMAMLLYADGILDVYGILAVYGIFGVHAS